MLFSAHRAARFCSNPKRSQEESVKRIGRYLKKINDKGIACHFDPTRPIEAHADAEFSRTWNLSEIDLLISTLSHSR